MKRKNNKITDHLGNTFEFTKDMCTHYKISVEAYIDRIEHGWSKEAALTTSMENYGTFDHLGNEFKTNKEMCEYYEINIDAFDKRINKLGWSLKDALTIPVRKAHRGMYHDHLGNKFKTLKELCDLYNIKERTYFNRLKKGLSLKDTLTMKTK